MKRSSKYNYQKNKKGKSKVLTITLLFSSIVMTGFVIWIGMNDWNISKSYEKAQEVLGISKSIDEGTEVPEKAVEPTELPKSEEDSNVPNKEPDDEDTIKIDDTRKEQGETSKQEPVKKSIKPSDLAGKPGKGSSTNVKIDAGGYIEGQKLPSEPTYVKGVLIANKKNPLPSNFAPGENKEARASFDKMAAEAKLSGFNITAFSWYRSYDYQVTLYDKYAAKDGKEAADTYSARPGYSEHQTGLAFDIGEVNFEKHWASSSFGSTEAGKWVGANAHRFGFILRYPKGKEHITGYMHESWHFRYVEEAIAKEVYERNITLEEYLEM
ncbi:M15 family metallopeptidase [Sporosarcina limicola]|nr:M15 family metallopeptidase [Sporosarcina limicola]